MTVADIQDPAALVRGYSISDTIFDSERTRVYRALRDRDGMSVILKLLRPDYATREPVARLQNEFEIMRRTEGEHLIRGYALERAKNLPVIVMEDIGGESLDRIIARRALSLKECLTVAVAVTAGLAELHAANVIHKDINPSNILYNELTGLLKIIDFGVSSALGSERAAATTRLLPGTLGYMSPEQTGRMNRSVDHRTDFYSLGATLYELLTRQQLFDVSEPIEWYHCHIAREPTPPATVDPAIPRVVSDIVMKLLAKTAENRYESARGINADLRRCLDQLRRTGAIEEFPLATQDIPDRFQVPQRLYGRDREVAALLNAFEEARGGVALALVTGHSGIGKSRLIDELQKPVTARRGFFVTGKFDQVHRDVPYSALLAALRDLVRQLLTDTAERLAEWKDKLLVALGGNGQLITDLIPELALIIGPQPAVPTLPAREAEQRFRLTMLEFLRVFGRHEHPLVLVLDDLQWADAGTLKLADLLIDTAEESHLLVIGAFRDNEVQPGHPLLEVLAGLQASGVSTTKLSLEPLTLPDLCSLIADALRAPTDAVEPLARLVQHKTEGNPFFVDEFLWALYQDALIVFDPATMRWVWDLERIATQSSTDNVVDLMTEKLRRLPPATQRLLELAACAGNRFQLSTLAVMAEQSPRAVAESLRGATAEGLVALVRDGYQLTELEQSAEMPALTVEFAFTHDRIQQTAYALLATDKRAAAHLHIGRLLLANLPAAKRDDNLFAIVNHLNIAAPLIDTVEEREQLARLNLAAGKRAKRAASYQIAHGHLCRALALLDDGIWQVDYPFALDTYTEAVEAAYLSVDYPVLDQLLETSFSNSRTLLDKIGFYEVQISALIARGELLPAIDIAKSVFVQLGHRYPARPNRLHVIFELMAVRHRLRGRSLESLRDLPAMTDPNELAASRIGGILGSAAMFAQPMLLPLMVLQGITMTLQHGHAPASGTSFGAFGMILAGTLGKIDEGDAYGRLGVEICEGLSDGRYTGRAHHVYSSLVQYWKVPLYDTLDGLRSASRICLENGDFEYAIHATTIHGKYAFMAGVELERLEHDTSAAILSLRALRQEALLYHDACLHQTVLNLIGQCEDPRRLVGEAYDIDKALPLHRKAGDDALVLTAMTSALLLRYCFDEDGDGDALTELADSASAATAAAAGFYSSYWTMFLEALARLRAATGADRGGRRRLLRQAARNQGKLKRFARNCPVNFANKYHLVEAERLRVLGRDFAAHSEYDRAIALSREHGFLHEQALANELCGRMHLAAARTTLGLPYLREARELYGRWGAAAKVRHLDSRYPQLVASIRGSTTRTQTVPLESVDITSLMKALKAIADERVHSRMVAAVIGTALEFAGAQRGVLALRNPHGDLLCIEAEAEIDSEPRILQSQPLAQSAAVAQPVVNYVVRTRTGLVVHDAATGDSHIPGLMLDRHVVRDQVKSILCLPLVSGAGGDAELMGLLYLENNRASNCFTDERFGTLELICVAAAGRLELSRKAAVDGLTDLYNHDYFQNMLKQEIATSTRHRRELSLILLDIDHFKQVNDTWGHQVGDRVLRDVADTIKLNSREGDTVARYGGEEIAVILPATGREEAQIVAERLRSAIESYVGQSGGKRVAVTVSLGVAVLDPRVNDAASLVQQADAALYRSKAAGRNRVTIAETLAR